MRKSVLVLAMLAAAAPSTAFAQSNPAADDKQNANPCRDEVAAALRKLRNSSWFRMESTMITENGLTNMTVDYVLPDRMHQKVQVVGHDGTQEVILIGKSSWSNEGEGWRALSSDITAQLNKQLEENVLSEQSEVGNYSCKGKVALDGKDVMSYQLEDEPKADSTAPKNEAFRMFYVDALTGLPVQNAILTPGREDKPVFKTSYSFPLDIRIEPPKDVKAVVAPADGAPASAPVSAPAPAPADATPAVEAPKAP